MSQSQGVHPSGRVDQSLAVSGEGCLGNGRLAGTAGFLERGRGVSTSQFSGVSSSHQSNPQAIRSRSE